MKKSQALLYKIVKIVRYLLQFPLIILNFLGNIYADFLLFIDRRNYSASWQKILQKSIDRYKSKNIIVSKNPEKSIKFYTPSLIASFRAKTIFTKEPDTIDWLNENGSKYNCLFDIGANLGLYSIYYAKKFDAKSILDNDKALNISQLTTLIKESSFIVANDTGPAHIAAHVGAKGLTLFGKHTTAYKVSIERENFKAIEVSDLKNLSAVRVFERLTTFL